MKRPVGFTVAGFIIFAIVSVLSVRAFADEDKVLRLATTTSTDNSGLLEYILPAFKKRTGIKTHVIPVGTGKALELARRGDVDAVLVHAPDAEKQFVEAGHGVNRRRVMVNDFVIVGPPQDPADLRKADNLKDALNRLIKSKATFISRGDDSGTHKKERKLWDMVGNKPSGENYLETGQGMEATLRIAGEKQAYTLTDTGTFLSAKNKLDLEVVRRGDETLENPYSAIAVNPARHPHANYMGAMAFIAWLTSPEGQAKIASYKMQGTVLFRPTAIPQGD